MLLFRRLAVLSLLSCWNVEALPSISPDAAVVSNVAALHAALAKRAPLILLRSGSTFNGQFIVEHACTIVGERSGSAPILTNAAFTTSSNVDSATLYLKAKGMIRLENVHVLNTAEDHNSGQSARGKHPKTPTLAVAVSQSTQAVLVDVKQKSWQDTFLCNGLCLLERGSISGWVDMIYGAGKAFLQGTTIYNRGCGGAIVAWRSTTGGSVVLNDVNIVRANDGFADVKDGTCWLARPWAVDSVVVVQNSNLGTIVNPKLWQANGAGPFSFAKGKTIFAYRGLRGPGYVEQQVDQSLTHHRHDFSLYTTPAIYFNGATWAKV
ncbi:hypothetical protein CBOM_01104 [Ceraceosorus bombacis]|uniref:pectinesterase n=1 Tax=Ceraceosorus bombacis TaxID=401625 RepID=A0A0P1BCR0_9BASI|nr:hypothetical protein CBOM_01104 [Ceraceosorus bombacis]